MQKQAKDHFSSAASHPPQPGDVGTAEIILKKHNRRKKKTPQQMNVENEGGDLSQVIGLCSLLELPTQQRNTT